MIREIVKEDFEMLMELYTQLGDNVVPEKNEEVDKLWNRILEDKNYEVSDECRMVEGSRHPCRKDDVPDRRGPGRDTDAWWHGRLDGGRQCSDRGMCCVPWHQPCRSAGTGERG